MCLSQEYKPERSCTGFTEFVPQPQHVLMERVPRPSNILKQLPKGAAAERRGFHTKLQNKKLDDEDEDSGASENMSSGGDSGTFWMSASEMPAGSVLAVEGVGAESGPACRRSVTLKSMRKGLLVDRKCMCSAVTAPTSSLPSRLCIPDVSMSLRSSKSASGAVRLLLLFFEVVAVGAVEAWKSALEEGKARELVGAP